ncbi:MAG TPA: HepT-like ribonuclease domain-containing protein [Longimicrobiaceae bacterium]|nr:HepT-like ribonuclease domain-containing protein [Longimicrobiaceae bacterium]
MPPEDRDLAHLWDMREFARAATSIAEGLTLERLRSNQHDQLALAKAIELVGEAASRLSKEFRDAHPEVPWSAIIGMRNRLVHDYRRIDFARVWGIVQRNIPPLLANLEALIPPISDEDEA